MSKWTKEDRLSWLRIELADLVYKFSIDEILNILKEFAIDDYLTIKSNKNSSLGAIESSKYTMERIK